MESPIHDNGTLSALNYSICRQTTPLLTANSKDQYAEAGTLLVARAQVLQDISSDLIRLQRICPDYASISMLQEQLTKARAAAVDYEEQCEELRGRMASELAAATTEKEHQTGKAEEAAQQLKQLSSKLAEVSSSLQRKEAELSQAIEECQQQEEQLRAMQKQIKATEQQMKQKEDTLQTMCRTCDDLTEELKVMEEYHKSKGVELFMFSGEY